MALRSDHPASHYDRAFAIGVALNVLFVLIEAGFGTVTRSLALIADAGHNFSDVIGLLLSWGASLLARRAATERRTYGFRKATIIASFFSAILLLVALGGITWEAVGRLFHPEPVQGSVVMIVAAVGVVINSVTAALFFSGQKKDLNIRGAFLHMAADAVVSLGVVAAGIVIALKGWFWVDPAISLFIVVVIFIGTWRLLRHSLNLTLDAVPEGIDITAIRSYLSSVEHIVQIHDLHVWAMSTTEAALTVHLVTTEETFQTDKLRVLQQHLHDRFGIAHSTIQVEKQTLENTCLLDKPTCD